MKNVYILDGARTPFGSFGKSLKNISATEMGYLTAEEAIKKSQVNKKDIDQVVYGNVIHSSTNAPYISRHIALQTGIPESTPSLTLNRLCGSGMQAVVSAAQSIMLNESEIALAGGSENMSMAPHSDFISRFSGKKLGSLRFEDMLLSALTDEYSGCGMGVTAENLAEKYNISRKQQDEYAFESHQRAAQAIDSGRFKQETISIDAKQGKETFSFTEDEHVKKETTVDK